jgi:leucyl aminopeptidase
LKLYSEKAERFSAAGKDAAVFFATKETVLGCSEPSILSAHKQLVECGAFDCKENNLYSFRMGLAGQEKLTLVVLIGAGEEPQSPQPRKVRDAMGKTAKLLEKEKAASAAVLFPESFGKKEVAKGGEGLLLGSYSFDDYRSEKKEKICKEITLYSNSGAALDTANVLAAAICQTRDLVNLTTWDLHPADLAKKAKKAGEKYGFEVEVFKPEEIEELGMAAFMAVGQGSANTPRLIVMRYRGNPESEEVLGFIGKGLCYDSGGYSMKPSTGMETMKSDMAGAAAVIGAMGAIAQKKLKVNVTAVAAACENMVSGNSYRPGDVISSMSGKTIEVDNTDAEGRLTLADAITYTIRKEKATKLVDIATLTGAAVVALGGEITAAVCDNDELWNKAEAAAAKGCEKIWRMPCDMDLNKNLDSKIADMKNTGERGGGCITAGLFLKRFTEGLPWLHLDIAGPSYTKNGNDVCAFGGTGCGVATLYYLAKAFEAER